MTFAEFVPHRARIAAIDLESADTRTFTLALDPPVAALDAARPGQFVMLSVLGHGEAAFTLSELPGVAGRAVITVRRVGRLTSALFALGRGAVVGVRGPFGRGFPHAPGEPTLYVAGGCGLSPLRPAIARQLATRPPGTRVAIVYGARDPDTRIHRASLAAWSSATDVRVIECVEHAARKWEGETGVVLDFLDAALAASGARRAVVCGPPVMLHRVSEALCRRGVRPENVHVALERHMKCGVGRCGHCYVDGRYVCTDGPVFSYAELSCLPDAFGAEATALSCSDRSAEFLQPR